MNWKAKADANQPEIVAALRKAGADIRHVHDSPRSGFDIVVLYMGSTVLVEIKDGKKPPSQRKLKKSEQECKDQCFKHLCWFEIITSVEEALALLDGMAKHYATYYRNC